MNTSKIRASHLGEPSNVTDQTLVCVSVILLCWRGIVRVTLLDGVNGLPRSIRSGVGVDVPVLQVETLNQVVRETSLIEVCSSLLVAVTPREVCAKKPLNDSHEFHLDETRQDALKYGFGLVIDGKIDEVIHIQPKSQMLS